MAEETPKLPGGLSVGPPGGAKKKARKPQVKKPAARPAGRPAPLVALHERYGLVYEPGQETDPLVKDELDALNELYRQRVGREIADEPDTRVALEQAGLLRPTVSRKRAVELRDGGGETFASALDALDAVAKRVEPELGAMTFGDYEKRPGLLAFSPLAQARFAVEEVLPAAAKLPVPSPALQAIQRGTGEGYVSIGDAAKAAAPALGAAVTRLPVPSPAAQAASIAAGKGYASIGEEGAQAASKALRAGGEAARRVISAAPIPSPATQVASLASGRGYVSFGDVSKTLGDAAINPNRFVDVSRKKPIIIPDSSEQSRAVIDLGKTGADTATINLQVGESNPFSPNGLIVMRSIARDNGWDVSDWDELSVGEKVFRTTNEKDDAALFWRSIVRNIGEMAAVPAVVPAVIEASADAVGGDTKSAEQLFRAVVEPYVAANETYKTRGFYPAAGEFIRDNPLDALTIFMSAGKGVSRLAGAAFRSGALGPRAQAFASRGRAIEIPGGTFRGEPRMPVEVPLPERVAPRGVGRQAAREALEENRRIEAERAQIAEQNRLAREQAQEQIRAYQEEGTMVEQQLPPLLVGRAGKGLAGTAFTQYVRAPIAEKFPLYRRFLERKRSARTMRIAYNEAQGRGLEIEAALTRAIGEGAPKEIKDRAAFNAFMPAVDANGTPITPGYVADFFRAELDELRADMQKRGGVPRSDDRDRALRLEAAIKVHDDLDRVVVPEDAMARFREELKPLGALNDADIAAAKNVDLETALRWNLIRVVAMDPRMRGGLEETAQLAYRERNAALPELQRIQERLKRRSSALKLKASVTGYGKYGPAASRRAFRKSADAMFADLRRGVELARQAQNPDLQATFERAIADLSRGRLSASEMDLMGRKLVEDIREMRLSPERVAALPAPSRTQYEAAQRLAEEERRVGSERVAALTEAGVTRVTRGSLDYAERRLASAVADLESYRSLPEPDPKIVERKARVVEKEQRARDSRLSAFMASERERELARKRQTRLDRAVMESGTGVMDTPEFRAVMDVSERFAVMEVKTRKDLFYRIDRARLEALDDYVNRLQAQDMMPAAHLVQTPDFETIGQVGTYTGPKKLDRSARGFMRAGRYEPSDGYLFVSAQETANYWDSLLRSTKEVRTAAVLQDKLGTLVEATSTPFRFTDDSLERARTMVQVDPELRRIADMEGEDKAFRTALGLILKDASPVGRADLDIGKFVVLNIDNPSAKTLSKRLSFGAIRSAEEFEDAANQLVLKTLDDRSLNPNAPGVYYIMPKGVYDGIQNAIRSETFRISSETAGRFVVGADRITRLWRAITLNVLPRTAINNTIGSTILAIQGGAGPRAIYYAWKAINQKEVRLASGEKALLPVPRELRQRYYEQMTDPISNAEGAFKPLAAWMNQMRFFNGMSEDLGRLAVWYHKAYPEAMRSQDGIRFFRSAQRLNDKSLEMLGAMARRDPNYDTLMDEFVEQSFDFLGDLHRGGPIASRIRIAIPFWQWYAHMLKLSFFTMPFRYPKRAFFLQMLADVGRDYQERVGISVPWGESFVPFYSEIVDTPGGRQQVVAGADMASWWPPATVSVLGGEEAELGILGFGQGAIAPMWTNSTLVSLSFLSIITGGEAFELDDRRVLASAKDEFGLPIEDIDSTFFSYAGNKMFRMAPLSPTIMSMAGLASNALPIPGFVEEKRYKTTQLPEEYRKKQRGDITNILQDWKNNWAGFVSKAILGSPWQYLPGRGPMEGERYLRNYEFYINDLEREERAVLDTMLERHDYVTPEGKNR